MKSRAKSVFLKKLDVFVLLLIIFVCALWFFLDFSKSESALTANVIVDGETVFSVKLDELNESEEKEFSGCVILFEKDGATVVSASCPNQLCVKEGKLKKGGEVCACVPNRVVLELRSEKQDADVISY